MDAAAFAALGEPNRLRIVELLNLAPRSVGEIASLLGLRQPQATKHLQALERAGFVTAHPLGQRRIYALRREVLRELRESLDAFTREHQSEAVLDEYRRAIEREHAAPKAVRVYRIRRRLRASPSAVWERWTSSDHMRRWWSPEHFTVVYCEADAQPGGAIRIEMMEGDGTRHMAAGSYVRLSAPRALSFRLAPLGSDGRPLFDAVHHVRFTEHGGETALSLTIRITSVRPGAEAALAGVRLGWVQLLDKLERDLAR